MITIMTPTYNRAKLLNRLYESLLRQKNTEFEWLIIDDGSDDDTKEVIEGFAQQEKIKIRYIYQTNTGKAAAFNNGVKNANGDLFLCVDSDDFLADNAVEMIENCYANIRMRDVAGIVALKQDNYGIRLGDRFPSEIEYASTFDLSEKYNCAGEWTIIFKTDVIKDNPFPIVSGEKFVTECVVYDKIAQKYKMFLLNEVITICEYQSDGLTNNIISNMIKNPTGYKIFYSQRIDMAYTLSKRIGYIVRYNVFKYMSRDKEYKYTGKYSVFVKLLSFTGIIGKKYYLRKHIKDERA